jgi:hypothetical protein
MVSSFQYSILRQAAKGKRFHPVGAPEFAALRALEKKGLMTGAWNQGIYSGTITPTGLEAIGAAAVAIGCARLLWDRG